MTRAPSLHVLPDARGSWHVRREGDERPLSEHDSETEAERAATLHAAATGAPEIIVHDRYQRVRRTGPLRP